MRAELETVFVMLNGLIDKAQDAQLALEELDYLESISETEKVNEAKVALGKKIEDLLVFITG